VAERCVGGIARDGGGAADRCVDALRDRVVGEPDGQRARAQRAEDAARDRVVHAADAAGAVAHLGRREPAERAQLVLRLGGSFHDHQYTGAPSRDTQGPPDALP
jgi:hypothetical protein